MSPTPAGTMLPPVVGNLYKKLKARRSSRDATSYIVEEDRKKSTSMSSLTVEGFHNDTLKNREKSNSSYLIKTSCEDVTIRTQQRYSDDNQKKKLASVFDYERLLHEEAKEFKFRMDNIPKPKGNLDDFLVQKKLACGRFGKVFLVQDIMEKKQYAMKTISKDIIMSHSLHHDVQAERDYLYSTNSPFIVSLIHHFEDVHRVYFIMEYVSGGDIFERLMQHGPFSEELTRFYTSQVILALEYLHNVQLIYRDLKPENMMIDSLGYVKLVDFGFVKKVKNTTKTIVGTPAYMAPEMVLHKPYDKTVDWWSLGILIYEMLAGCQNTPFVDPDRMAMYEKITSNKEISFRNKFPPTIVRDLIKRLLKVNSAHRLGAGKNGSRDVKNHPWFASVKWEDIYRRNVTPPRNKSNNSLSKSNGNYQSKRHNNHKVTALKDSLLGGGAAARSSTSTLENRAKFEKFLKIY